jgi:hypothetical protein
VSRNHAGVRRNVKPIIDVIENDFYLFLIRLAKKRHLKFFPSLAACLAGRPFLERWAIHRRGSRHSPELYMDKHGMCFK